jgi:ribonuclease Z
VVAGEPLLRFEMEPQPSRINREDCVGKVPNNQQRTTAALKYPPRENNVSDITVQFLGTGSMTPSKYRNVSGISLTFGERGHFLMDTGEGSLGQLFRMHGPTGVREYLQTLRGIFISHLHADHHLGLMRVIQEYGKVRCNPHDKVELI